MCCPQKFAQKLDLLDLSELDLVDLSDSLDLSGLDLIFITLDLLDLFVVKVCVHN